MARGALVVLVSPPAGAGSLEGCLGWLEGHQRLFLLHGPGASRAWTVEECPGWLGGFLSSSAEAPGAGPLEGVWGGLRGSIGGSGYVPLRALRLGHWRGVWGGLMGSISGSCQVLLRPLGLGHWKVSGVA